MKSKYEMEVENFRSKFADMKNKRIAIYGIGRRTATLLPEIRDFNIVGLLDRDNGNIGKSVCDVKVITIDNIDDKADIIIINSDPSNYKIIYKRIATINIPIYYSNGERALPDVEDNSYENNSYWMNSYDELVQKIDYSDVVSFDLFDTLIMRRVFSPEDVYRLVERKAENCNICSKKTLNDFLAIRPIASSMCNDNSYLMDIYKIIGDKLGIDENDLNNLMNLEIETDIQLCIPRKTILKIYDYAVEKGKDVYIVSDMYYPLGVVRKILESCGIRVDDDSHIWISCEKHMDKASGCLWNKFTKEVVRGRKCIHIGDNIQADVENPKKFGIESYHIMNGKDMLINSSAALLSSYVCTEYDSVCMGNIVSKMFNDPFALGKTRGKVRFDNSNTYGYCVYGPMIMKFLLWLYGKSHKDEINKLLFFARDGYFLEKDYRLVSCILDKQTGNKKQDIQYLPISRRLIYIATIENEEDFKRVVEFPYVGTFKDYMYSRFNIVVNDKSQEYNNILVNAVSDADKILTWIRPYEDEIKKEIMWERNNYIKYLEKMNMFTREKYGTVDLGYYGTNQFYLQKLLKRKMKGYCLTACLSEKNIYINDIDMCACFQDAKDPDASESLIRKKNMYVETFLTAPYGMIRYIDENMQMVCEPDKKSQYNFDIKEEVNAGVQEYINDYLNVIGADILNDECSMLQDEIFFEFLNGKAMVSDDILKGFYFDNDFIGSQEIEVEI